jgi:hypothetical protein
VLRLRRDVKLGHCAAFHMRCPGHLRHLMLHLRGDADLGRVMRNAIRHLRLGYLWRDMTLFLRGNTNLRRTVIGTSADHRVEMLH